MENEIEAKIIEKYRIAAHRLVLLDYDGTLVNYAAKPETAKLSEHVFDILSGFIENPLTKIFIITGRSHLDIEKLLSHVPIDIIAEHGAMVRESGLWKSQAINNFSWKKAIIPIMNQFTGICKGSSVEEKNFSVTWHYRNADPEIGYECSRELIELLTKTAPSYNLKILDGKKVVEILSNETGKGRAVKKLFEKNTFDFVLSIGDDATDEEMFEYLLNFSNAYTIKVGEGTTFAKYQLTSIGDVAVLLKQILG
jgi:trehalose 6-phosphate synthase/phosphatase